ncbi:MAG: hypothetical protein RIS00_725 [Pseudomonadota bacterium]|jgi:hypothetical protein|nr:PilZ domain-containing protein [Sphingorhabdus sp.]
MPYSAKGKSEPAKGIEFRRYSRGDVNITIDLREFGGGRMQAQIVDISQSGCRIATVSHLNDHGRIFITLPGFGPLEAEVVWRIGESYGCAFVAPLHAAVFDHILAKFPSLGPG